MITAARLQEIRAAVEAASPHYARFNELRAVANLAPELLSELDRLRAEAAELERRIFRASEVLKHRLTGAARDHDSNAAIVSALDELQPPPGPNPFLGPPVAEGGTGG